MDSSVAALLLKGAGYDCIGATMLLHDGIGEENSCAAAKAVEDAQAVAQRMGLPFQVFCLQDAFREYVIENFIHCYECGLTPNPCIQCNRHLKFDAFLQKALELGCDYIATGHYAQIRWDESSGRYQLCKAADAAKDQTYFLYTLTQEQLAHVRFPLGGLTKSEAREIAEAAGFVTARKRDSQDICFVPDGDYVRFMERYTGKTYIPGDYLDLDGNVVGQHKGAVHYTFGQRKGLGIALGAPVYVCRKDMSANTVTVGPNEALYSRGLRAKDWNWFPFPTLTEPLRVTAKARHSQTEQPAMVYPEENGFARVVFDTPQRALTPGQAVVLYQGNDVIGGGTITKILSE